MTTPPKLTVSDKLWNEIARQAADFSEITSHKSDLFSLLAAILAFYQAEGSSPEVMISGAIPERIARILQEEPMTLDHARTILGATITGDGSINTLAAEPRTGLGYVSYHAGDSTANLDDDFTADELEAIAVWMRHNTRDRMCHGPAHYWAEPNPTDGTPCRCGSVRVPQGEGRRT